MSSEHFIKLCKHCTMVISQCRCPSENKKIIWDICDNCKNLSEPTINNSRANEMNKCYTIKPLDFDYENGYNYTGMYEEWTAKSPIGNFQIDVNTSEAKKFELIKWIDEEVGSTKKLDRISASDILHHLQWQKIVQTNFYWMR